ncbi:TonB-dependent receptor [Mangrovibacterium diazotrophicum]|uniref:TonB-linked SusC/RagA family outer membrane protein n=1 Tax=Mangrovibacterium diazotrophicum TaxID=1261403 RepID=A0A419WBD9_9BACT|nr:TonB-dependent receptor [Mangrovibacterium diazotrophicum]RKD92744.1 TonB-linked SusC/RagA family outer membrane protein [Mangrovibacterium diazotrophicum]
MKKNLDYSGWLFASGMKKLFLIMKLTTLFTFLIVFHVSASSYSQATKFKLKLNEKTIKDVLIEIEEQSQFHFLYNDEFTDLNRTVTVNTENADVEEVLDQIFANSSITYKVLENNLIVLTPSGGNTQVAQSKTVKGNVKDKQGAPLPGVTVVEKGTTNGTITDFDGNYAIEVPTGATLVFSFVGMQVKEIAVAGQANIDVVLEEETLGIDEVVVVGYGTQKKSDIISSIATMDAEKLNERPVNKVDQALIGQMAGVRVQQTSGLPGQGFSIQVRGTGSISANNEPLYVVDGFPLEVSPQSSSGGFSNGNPLTNLNPNDIESIQVLKDAAAASIYGSRGSNGVVIITTKKGKTGRPQISFNTYVGWNETAKKLDVLSSDEWVERQIEHMNYFWVRDHASDLGATSSQTNNERRALLGLADGQYNVKYMWDDRWLEDGHPGLDYVDWQDLYFRKGMVQSYQLSATGGNDIVRYYISGDYMDQEGVAIGVKYRRYSARANVEVSPTENLKFGINLSPSYSVQDDPGVEGKDAITHIIVGMNPVVESSTGPEGVNVGDNTMYAWGTSRVSPIAEAKYKQRDNQTFRTITTAFLEYQFIKGLKFRTNLNFDVHNNEASAFTPAFVTRNRTATGSKSGYNRINFVNENTLNYNKSIGDHNFDLLGGYSYSKFKLEDYSISGTGFASDDIPTLNAANTTSGTSTNTENVLISYFGRLQYNYMSKYLLQASLRRDGSSKFGDNTKWGVFPSVSVGWKIINESFMADNEIFSDLKLRASWGLAGNNGVGDYDQIARLAYANYSNNGTLVNGLVPSNFANPDLSWETSETVDVGFDAGLLGGRIYTSFDYYTKRNTDLLLSIPVPTASGFDVALTNIGEVLNKGWELELTTQNLVNQFKWKTMFNLSHNTNEVKKLGPNNTPILGGAFDITHNILEVGKPMYTLYLVQQDGLLTSEDIANGVAMYNKEEAGDPKYVDQNGDGVIDGDDRTYSGHPNPDYVWGITNEFSWKGFDLSILIQGQTGGMIYSTFGRAMYRTGMGSNENTLGKTRDRVRWVEGQVLTAADVAGKERKSPSTFGRIKNTDWLYKNDYWRIRNITLGYDLGRLIHSNLISGARIYATAENFFGKDKYDGGFNPEAVNNSGDDYGAFPLSKSMVFGLNLKF